MPSRRQFVMSILPTTATIVFGVRFANAQVARIEESDAAAVALGYKHAAAKVDAKKYPAWAAGRNCANCQLYQAKASEPWGACGALGGKLVKPRAGASPG